MINIEDYELIFDNIVILPDANKAPAPGQLITGEQKKPNIGTVVLIGKGKQAEDTGVFIEMQIQKGDRVIFDSFVAVPFMDSEYVILEQGYVKSKIK